jgi:hypothetical protein
MTIPLQRQRHHRTDDAGADDSRVTTTVHRDLRGRPRPRARSAAGAW